MLKFNAALMLLLVVSVCHAQNSFPIVPLTLEGDSVPGVGLVDSILNLAINDNGDTFVEIEVDIANTDEDNLLLKNGVAFIREGIVGEIAAPSGTFVDSFDSVTINNSGKGGFNFFIEPLDSNSDSGIYVDKDLVIQESNFSTAPEFSAGTFFRGYFDVKINNNDTLMTVASVDDPSIASSVDRAIMLIDGATQSVIAKEGDILPGQTEAVEDFGTGPHESAFNDKNQVMFVAELTGSTTSDHAIYLDQTLLAQEGLPSPILDRNYQTLALRALDLNNNGDYVFEATLSGDVDSNHVLIKNGDVFKQEGDAVPNGFNLTGFGSNAGPLKIGDNGNVLWFGEWDDPDTAVNSGLFINDNLIVQKGVSTVDGVVIESINSFTDQFSMSADGKWVIFEATLEGSINGAFAIELADPVAVVPAEIVVTGGRLNSGSVAELSASDNEDLSLFRDFQSVVAVTEFVATATSPVAEPTSFEVTLEGSVFARSAVEQSIALWNYDTNAYEVISTENASRFLDASVSVSATGALERFLGPANELQVRVRYRGLNPRLQFSSNTDHFFWTIE